MKSLFFKAWFENQWHWPLETGGYASYPVVYIRFGDIPVKNGAYTSSTNHFTGGLEKGVSVYPAYYDRMTKKFILSSGNEQYLGTQGEINTRPAFLVSGQEIGVGADGEPVLDPISLKVLRKLDYSEIVDSEDNYMTLSGEELPDTETPKLRSKIEEKDDYHELRRNYFSLVQEIAKKFKNYKFIFGIHPYKNKPTIIMDEKFNLDKFRKIYEFVRDNNFRLLDDDQSMFQEQFNKTKKLFKVDNGKIRVY